MTKKDFDVISFGEIMLRLSPPSNERIVRGEVFHKCAGGSELNVALGRVPAGTAHRHHLQAPR